MIAKTELEDAYLRRSAQLRGLAATLSGDRRETLMDAADHWEMLAQQACAVARAKKLIKDWQSVKAQ